MDIQTLVAGIYEETGVDVAERDDGKLDTLGACVAYVAAHLPA